MQSLRSIVASLLIFGLVFTQTTAALGLKQSLASDPKETPVALISDTVVISQVYGAGGNAGATHRNDFIELFNRGNTTVSLAGWSVQYASATGTGSFSGGVTTLSGSIAPGQYYLVQESSGG